MGGVIAVIRLPIIFLLLTGIISRAELPPDAFEDLWQAAFDINQIEGLQLWHRHDLITGHTNAGVVANNLDYSIWQRNATQTNSANCPTYITNGINGMSVLRFNRTNWMSYAYLPHATQSFFAVAVIKTTMPKHSGIHWSGSILQCGVPGGNDRSNSWRFATRSAGLVQENNATVIAHRDTGSSTNNLQYILFPVDVTNAAPTVVSAAFSSFSDVVLRANGATDTNSVINAGIGWNAGYRLGEIFPDVTTRAFADVGEVALWQPAPSLADQYKIIYIVKQRWGVQ